MTVGWSNDEKGHGPCTPIKVLQLITNICAYYDLCILLQFFDIELNSLTLIARHIHTCCTCMHM